MAGLTWTQDRNSIGNARVAGMQKSLGLSNDQYSLTVSMFCSYLTYSRGVTS